MSLTKLYTRIDWENNTTPAINETNLNLMSKAIDDIDDRVIDLGADILLAETYATNAANSATNAATSESNASGYADAAEESALVAEGYAAGTQNGVEVSSGTYYENNAKYYAEQAASIVDCVSWDDYAQTGAVNLLPNTASTQTINGLTFTVNSDGSVTVTGTASATTTLAVGTIGTIEEAMTLSGCPSGGTISTYEMQIVGADTVVYRDYGSGTTLPAQAYANPLYIVIRSGYAISGSLTFKPMICSQNYDGDYVPYAKTNKELTDDVASNTSQISDLTTTSDITSSVTFPNATLIYGGVFRNGNICTIKCNIQITTEIGNGKPLISNVPTPLMKGLSSGFSKLCPVRASMWSLTPSKWHLQTFSRNSAVVINTTQTLNVGDIVDLDWTYIIDE